MKRERPAFDHSMRSVPVPDGTPAKRALTFSLRLTACVALTVVLSCATRDSTDVEPAQPDPPPVREPVADASTPPPLPDLAPLPELEIGDDAPLLLDGGGSEPAATTAAAAANQACFHCHANYEEDPLVQRHAREDIGCADCHGQSLAHQNDENNITPPDVMVPLAVVDKACAKCHDHHDAPATEVLARWRARCPEKTEPGEIVCTDCHGDHRLRVRTVRWNRRTGELLTAAPQAGSH